MSKRSMNFSGMGGKHGRYARSIQGLVDAMRAFGMSDDEIKAELTKRFSPPPAPTVPPAADSAATPVTGETEQDGERAVSLAAQHPALTTQAAAGAPNPAQQRDVAEQALVDFTTMRDRIETLRARYEHVALGGHVDDPPTAFRTVEKGKK